VQDERGERALQPRRPQAVHAWALPQLCRRQLLYKSTGIAGSVRTHSPLNCNTSLFSSGACKSHVRETAAAPDSTACQMLEQSIL
jgi:hypothetical protein